MTTSDADADAERAAALAALRDARDAIEALDAELVALLARRVALSRTIGTHKRAADLPTLDPAREADVIRRAAALAREQGLDGERVRDIFWQVIGLSRHAQERG